MSFMRRSFSSAPRLPGLCVLTLPRASSQPGLPGPMRLVPPGSKHVHMPALSAVMTWIYVVFAKEMRSTNGMSRGAGLRRFPCLYFPAPRAQNAPKTSCLCLLLRAVYGHFALVDLPQSRKFSSLRGFASGGPAGLASGGPAGQTRQHPARVYVMGVVGLGISAGGRFGLGYFSSL